MASAFSSIGLIGKYGDPSVADTLVTVSNHLRERDLNVLLDNNTAENFSSIDIQTASRQEMGEL